MTKRSIEELNRLIDADEGAAAPQAGVTGDTYDGDDPPEMPDRVPFGSLSQRLDYPERPGYHRHWFNDSPGRVLRAQQAGYKHVLDHEGKVVGRPVGTANGGGVLMGYLMEIPRKWWERDLQEAQDEVDRRDAEIQQGNTRAGKVGEDNRYVPKSRPIRITHGSQTPR
jgi:hypothetical protein